MSATLVMHPFFSQQVGENQTLVVQGGDVRECLTGLIKQYPAVEKKLFDKEGKLRGYVEIYVNGKTAHPHELTHPITGGDEIRVIVFGAGG